MNTADRMVSKVLYSLKRKYLARVIIHRRLSETVDLSTGVKTPVIQDWEIERAILLPNDLSRKFVYDLTFIASNKNFTYGGTFDTGERRLILDANEVPVGFIPNRDDYIVYLSDRYEISDIGTFGENKGWILKIKTLTGAPVEAVHSHHVRSTLHLNSEVELEP